MSKSPSSSAAKQTPQGLSDAEVAAAKARGEVNVQNKAESNTTLEIIFRNTFTLFNAVNVAFAFLIFLTGSYKNMLFLVVVIANSALAIAHEIKAKRLLDKLVLLTKERYLCIRENKEHSVYTDELVKGDLIGLQRGQTVPCDMRIQVGEVYVNESLLTGESVSQKRSIGQPLITGSFITAGNCLAVCENVGTQTRLSKINAEAKLFKLHISTMMVQMKWIIKICSIALFPLGILLFCAALLSGGPLSEAILSTSGALIGMIPQGLVLLISSVLAFNAYRLARDHVLTQNLYSPQLLSEVDMLVLDKTGTITSNKLEVEGLYDAEGHPVHTNSSLASVLAEIIAANKLDTNETAAAISSVLPKRICPTSGKAIPFSSEKKYSGVEFTNKSAYLMGAPGFLGVEKKQEQRLLSRLDAAMRILFVAKRDPQNHSTLLGAILLKDQLRPGIQHIIRELQSQEVAIKVISGDGLEAVQSVAKAAGVADADHAIDLSQVSTTKALHAAAEKTTIFARALPEQKQELIAYWQSQNNKVAMTGDGVNDVLALKKAHCAVSFEAGSDAARSIADIVLLNNDFSGLAKTLKLGRTSTNNLMNSAGLFLTKTLTAMLLSLFCIFFPPFIFEPIQLTLLSALCIGIPSIVLGFWLQSKKVTSSFLAHALTCAFPTSLAICGAITTLIVFAHLHFFGLEEAHTPTMALVFYAIIGFAAILFAARALKQYKYALVAFLGGAFVLATLCFPAFFSLTTLNYQEIMYLLLLAPIWVALFCILIQYFQKKLRRA